MVLRRGLAAAERCAAAERRCAAEGREAAERCCGGGRRKRRREAFAWLRLEVLGRRREIGFGRKGGMRELDRGY
ncbi:hypothetical protein E3N88_17855 [Mikania micrantha]|uniref:Uncharacterized protein n=1 Tax=Mikania micrantha TaxID=192012 RepID=A0A5N6NUD7_9ASTR|nr:hypothetical protein E3N88_17855 [Mikania micrantha]